MRIITFCAISIVVACNSTQKTTSESADSIIKPDVSGPINYAETITEAELKDHLYIYASDEFEGRETGRPGQKMAVEYLRGEYESLQISAARPSGEYFQKVPLEVGQVPTGSIIIDGEKYPLGEDFLTFSKAEGLYKDIVYAGYGIEEVGYSDYKGLNVAGKVILIKSGEPIDKNGNYILSGSAKKSVWSNMSESMGKRIELASDKGAVAVFYFDENNYGRFKNRFDYMKNNDSGRMQLFDDDKADFANFFINSKIAKVLLPDIETNNTPKLLPIEINITIKSDNTKIDSENVAAVIMGSEKPDEYVIISSHLDHIGVNADGQINNGADDDGSGTVALLEIAEAFKKAADADHGPKRSVVFLHVTGEEKGLLGSQYYTDFDPIFPLRNTVANLNIDMIGRIDPKYKGNRNYLYLIGSDKLSTELHELSEAVNKKYMNIEFDYTFNDENDPNRFYYRSDHYNFAKNNIPIIFYFNGTHADYHRPSDTVEKINYDLLENRTRLIFYTAWEIANRDQRLIVDKTSK